jgi:hypothetical protein
MWRAMTGTNGRLDDGESERDKQQPTDKVLA